MKRATFLFLAAAAMMLFAACDPACDIVWVMANRSGHDVEITCYETVVPCPANDYADTSVRTHVTTLKNGESREIENYGGIGTTSYGTTKYRVRYGFWYDSVRFAYDDGSVRTFVADRDTSDGPYNFNSANYTYQEKAHEGRTFKGEILWSRLTYTLTAEDYERWCAPQSEK